RPDRRGRRHRPGGGRGQRARVLHRERGRAHPGPAARPEPGRRRRRPGHAGRAVARAARRPPAARQPPAAERSYPGHHRPRPDRPPGRRARPGLRLPGHRARRARGRGRAAGGRAGKPGRGNRGRGLPDRAHPARRADQAPGERGPAGRGQAGPAVRQHQPRPDRGHRGAAGRDRRRGRGRGGARRLRDRAAARGQPASLPPRDRPDAARGLVLGRGRGRPAGRDVPGHHPVVHRGLGRLRGQPGGQVQPQAEPVSEPKGRGVAWTEERGTSDEGRRRLKAPRRRAGYTGDVIRIVARGGEVVLVTEPAPEPRRGEVLVATQYSVISPGTERTILEATRAEGWASHEYPEPGQAWPHVRSGGVRHDLLLPRPSGQDYASLGYSLAGRVVAVAEDVTDLVPGDLGACGGSQCAFHSEQVAVPRNLTVRVPDGLGPDLAAFVTLGSIALEALRRSGRTLGETIVVFGCGVLGVLITMLARAAGIYVVAVDPDPRRLEVAAGAGAIPAAGGDDLAGQVRART